jgi:hypothetical protein
VAKRKSYRKSARRAGGIVGGTGKKIMIGLGAAMAGGIIGNMLGVNKMLPSVALGYLGAGGIGAVTSLASEMLTGGGGLGSLFGLRSQGGNVKDAFGQSSAGGTIYS